MNGTLGAAAAARVARVADADFKEAMLRRRLYGRFQREREEEDDGLTRNETDPLEELKASITNLLEALKRLLRLW